MMTKFGVKTMKKTAICTALTTALGMSALALSSAASAGLVADGSYDLVVLTTPTQTTFYGATSFKFGTDGNWRSSFSFGGTPSPTSQGMTDNGVLVGGVFGSSIAGDGFAGAIGVTVTGDNLLVPGEIGMSGTIDAAGAATFNPTGRLGAVSGFPLNDLPWNIDDAQGNCDANGCTSTGNTSYQTFTTGAFVGPAGTINGKAISALGDVDGDGLTDYQGIFVTGGQVGSTWGGFFGAVYYEVWDFRLLSNGSATGFNVDTIFGTAGGDFAQYTVIPVPAAVWLFGSGLLGLVGVARRKKA
jgi:hypothetical protein